MRERDIVSGHALLPQLFLRDATQHPIVASLWPRESADDAELLYIEPRFGIANVAHDQGMALPSLRGEHHGREGTAATNCESPFVSTIDAYALAAPAAIFTRTVMVSSSGMPRPRSASAW